MKIQLKTQTEILNHNSNNLKSQTQLQVDKTYIY